MDSEASSEPTPLPNSRPEPTSDSAHLSGLVFDSVTSEAEAESEAAPQPPERPSSYRYNIDRVTEEDLDDPKPGEERGGGKSGLKAIKYIKYNLGIP